MSRKFEIVNSKLLSAITEFRRYKVGSSQLIYNSIAEFLNSRYSEEDYFYKASPTETLSLNILNDLFVYYYQDVFNKLQNMRKVSNSLQSDITQIKLNSENSVNNINVSQIFEETNILLLNYSQILEARVVPFRAFNYLREPQKIAFKNFASDIGRYKPDSLKRFLRKFIPRWIYHPLELPEEISYLVGNSLEEDDLEVLIAEDINFIDQLNSGDVTIPSVFKFAEALEKKGMSESGFIIRSWGIRSLLSMEKIKIDNDEIPILTKMLPAIVSSQNNYVIRVGTLNLVEQIDKTFGISMQIFNYEASKEEPDIASEFLLNLKDTYGLVFPELMALAINKYGKSGIIDEAEFINSLKRLKIFDTKNILNKFAILESRKVMNAQEVEEIVNTVTLIRKPKVKTIEEIENDINVLIEDEDSYSFTLNLNQISNTSTYFEEAFINIDLDNVSESINGKIIVKTNDYERELNFKLNFTAEIESIILDTVFQEEADQKTLDLIRDIVISSINLKAEKSRKVFEKKAKLESKPKTFERVVLGLSREERLELYTKQKELYGRKRRNSVKQTEIEHPENKSVSVYKDHSRQPEIINLSTEIIQEIFKQERIENIDPVTLIEKLEHQLLIAALNKKMLGKKISLATEFGINLRQVNWTLDGGSTAIRIYLEDIGDGKFALRGIHRKKGINKQTRYIKSLISDLKAM